VKACAKKIRQSPKLPARTRREQLLQAACGLFVRKGYRTTTTDEIASKAGLTKGAVYFHFKNKEDILFELVKQISTRHDAQIIARGGCCITPSEFVRLLTEQHQAKGPAGHQDVADLWVQALRIPRIKRYISRRAKTFARQAADLLDPACAAGKTGRQDLVVLLLALHTGLAIQQMVSPTMVDMEKQIIMVERLFGKGIKLRKRSRK